MWQMGKPITGYYHGPGAGTDRWGPLTPGMAEKLVDGGFNMAWGTTVDDLDVAHDHDLRLDLLCWEMRDPTSLDDPARRARIDAVIDQVKDHPAMYAYNIFDEPGANQFSGLARMVSYLRERDPDHLAHINLFPTYASSELLGTTGDTTAAYREHLCQYLDVVKPELISHDHYHLFADHDGDEYYLNLALIREAAMKAGVPFLNVVQACSLGSSHRVPNGDEGRYLAYTTLAYGGMGLSQFVYWIRVPDFIGGGVSEYGEGPFSEERAQADVAAPLTPLGSELRNINREFVAIAEQLQRLKSRGAYHLGPLPSGGVAPPSDLEFYVDPPVDATAEKGILLGCFGTAGETTHVLVVNLDYQNEISTAIVGPAAVEEFDALDGTWTSGAGGPRASVSLTKGGGRLFRARGA